MSEETKEGTTSDEALNQAAEQAEETPKTEETPSETKTEEQSELEELKKENQRVKSELGRAQKAMNEISDMRSKVSSLEALLQNQAIQKETEQSAETLVTTEQDVTNVLQKWEKKKQAEQDKYTNDYLNNVASFAQKDGLDDKQMLELEDILKTSITNSDSNFQNAQYDAKVNYLQAKLILKEKSEKSVNLKGDTPKGTGIGKPSENGGSEKNTMPKLDPIAQEYVDKMGMSAEEVTKALKGL
jgi:hypothetical protein